MPKIVEAKDAAFRAAASVGAFKGAVKDLSNRDYHGLKKYWSSSDLKFLHSNTPAHFHYKYFGEGKGQSKKATKDMILGSLVHCLLLEPHAFESDFFVMPEINLRTNDGKAQREKLLSLHAGKLLIDVDMMIQAQYMKASCEANPKALELLREGYKELAFFWECPYSNLTFKAKTDSSRSSHFVELKTTSDASPEGFSRHAFNMNYDLSLVHYMNGIKSVFDVSPPAFFVVIESEPPYVTEVYRAGESFIQSGHDKWLKAVDKLTAGIREGKWPSYSAIDSEIPILEAPSFAVKQMLKDEVI